MPPGLSGVWPFVHDGPKLGSRGRLMVQGERSEGDQTHEKHDLRLQAAQFHPTGFPTNSPDSTGRGRNHRTRTRNRQHFPDGTGLPGHLSRPSYSAGSRFKSQGAYHPRPQYWQRSCPVLGFRAVRAQTGPWSHRGHIRSAERGAPGAAGHDLWEPTRHDRPGSRERAPDREHDLQRMLSEFVDMTECQCHSPGARWWSRPSLTTGEDYREPRARQEDLDHEELEKLSPAERTNDPAGRDRYRSRPGSARFPRARPGQRRATHRQHRVSHDPRAVSDRRPIGSIHDSSNSSTLNSAKSAARTANRRESTSSDSNYPQSKTTSPCASTNSARSSPAGSTTGRSSPRAAW